MGAQRPAARYSFASELYTTPSFGPIAFLSVPETIADSIEALPALPRRGFGSRRVEVTALSATGTILTWRTSIFPSTETYVLPIKQKIRKACAVDIGDELSVEITMLDDV